VVWEPGLSKLKNDVFNEGSVVSDRRKERWLVTFAASLASVCSITKDSIIAQT